MSASRRILLQTLAAAAAATTFALPTASHAQAAAWPTRPIKWIVPFPPGGPTDVFSRAVAQQLQAALGQPVVVENRGGAGGGVGMQALAKSAPDGYTIGLSTTGTHAINPALYGEKLGYDPLKDFTPLTLAVSYVNMLVVHANHPAKNVKELVEYAEANPGKVMFGSAGNGSSNHLSGEVLKLLTGAPMQHVPYRGSALAMNDTIAGQITSMFDILNVAIPQSRSGRVRALAVTSGKRSPYSPDVPTMEEAGVPGYSAAGSDLWFGIMAPAGLPNPVADKLQAALVTVLRSPEMRQTIRAQFFEPWTSTPEDFLKVIRTDGAKWAKIVTESGARVD
ncbi:MAG TPA: tripartite tricarboxylate transporter substrate binding protein [Aquabacterium sp.]|nr:tripartite tricarboxylate transporter substrate binding protein [Aquabacterium sp.]HQC96909.1 tripartite tricarboxylate transporter substrate binding protein [Aquabacterium sp.]